jgi:hypothetical protein
LNNLNQSNKKEKDSEQINRRKTTKKTLSKVTLAAIITVILILPVATPVSAASPGLQKMTTTNIDYAQAGDLTADEEYWLIYMREEEKLARDVYFYLYDKWNSRIFNNIPRSEQRHMDSIKSLLDSYRISDPTAGKVKGEFTNEKLQALYNELINQGSVSLVEALKVGVIIEETDIDDLEKAISLTNRNDIKTVYNNLLQGSLNHLGAFNSKLAKY